MDFRQLAGRVGLTLLLDGEIRPGRLRPIRPAGVDVTVADNLIRRSDPRTILVQATSLLGLFYDHGPLVDIRLRSAFRSLLGPTRIEASRPQPIVSGAWYVGLLLRTAG